MQFGTYSNTVPLLFLHYYYYYYYCHIPITNTMTVTMTTLLSRMCYEIYYSKNSSEFFLKLSLIRLELVLGYFQGNRLRGEMISKMLSTVIDRQFTCQ